MEFKELISVFRRTFTVGKMMPFFKVVPMRGGCLKLKNALALVVSFSMIAIDSMPAHANTTPGSLGEVMFAYMIPVAIIIMTILGGGYAILNRLKVAKGKPTSKVITVLKNVVKIAFWVFVILYSMAIMYAGLLMGMIFSIYAIYRSYMLIRWGMVARRSDEKPDYLTDAKPARLIYAGSALIMITVVLSALALMFAVHGQATSDNYGSTKKLEEIILKKLVSVETKKLTYLENKKAFQKELATLSVQTEAEMGKLNDAKRRYIVEYQSDQSGFTAFLLPEKGSIIFTYPSYRADYTADGKGKIRRIWVRKLEERCPENADVIWEW
jgi:hypothetical protein